MKKKATVLKRAAGLAEATKTALPSIPVGLFEECGMDGAANFVEAAVQTLDYGATDDVVRAGVRTLARKALLSNGSLALPFDYPEMRANVRLLSGTYGAKAGLIGQASIAGPRRPAPVVVVGKQLGFEEDQCGINFVGPTSRLLHDELRMLRVDTRTWYFTNVIKFLPPMEINAVPASWLRDFKPLLKLELALTRPKLIVCLGADAVKAVVGKGMKIGSGAGALGEIEYASLEDDKTIGRRMAKVIGTVHPAYVYRTRESLPQFRVALGKVAALATGQSIDGHDGKLRHYVVKDVENLRRVLARIDADVRASGDNLLAVDAEWNGRSPKSHDAYVRTLQIAWKDRHAVAIVFNTFDEETEKPVNLFGRRQSEAIGMLREFFADKRVSGHFFYFDLQVLKSIGLDLTRQYAPAPTWERTAAEGGFDTGLAMHAMEETAELGLDDVCQRFTTAPMFWEDLEKWKDDYCRRKKIKKKKLPGYGPCPDRVLLPYGTYDADVEKRLTTTLSQKLSADVFGNNCWEPFWRAHRACLAVVQIHETGLLIDRDRMDRQTMLFFRKRTELRDKLQASLKWPKFNPESTIHLRELLFGEELNGRKVLEGEEKRVRPPDGLSLKATPVLTTGKRQKPWEEAIADMSSGRMPSPSVDKKAVAVLFNKYLDDPEWGPLLADLRDYRIVAQVMKGFFREPLKEEGEYIVNGDGHYEYNDGLPSCIDTDGRVRTQIRMTTDTGRWASSDPNLQNIAGQIEAEYLRIFGEQYAFGMRGIFKASPGHLLVEADYQGAELMMGAVMSGCAAMIDHCQRAALPESDPRYYDIHSNVAVTAFRLECEPTKKGLKSLGKAYLRTVAKAIAFGLLYGRSASAIAVECRRQGIDLSDDEAEGIISAIFQLYPELDSFLKACANAVIDPGYLSTCFRRRRRFLDVTQQPKDKIRDYERQAKNFPFQGGVADAVNEACANFIVYQQQPDAVPFRIALQIHDALLFEVPIPYLAPFVREVLPACMVKGVPLVPTNLRGVKMARGPYYFGIDNKICEYWGESISPERATALGVEPGLVD